jgi:hypothetical protein
MNRIANKIQILTGIKTDYVLDENGSPTEETYQYKEFQVLDAEDYLLEEGRCEVDATEAEILEFTGIVFGVSTWVY